MASGLTLYDPDLAVPHVRRHSSTASYVVKPLDVDWKLPPLKWSGSMADSNASIVNIAIEAPANLTPSRADEPPPNGGWLAWMQVLGAFFLYFNSW
jgi:hypothetical protein